MVTRLLQEWVSLYRFFRPANRPWRRIVLYSERAVYHQYFEGLLEGLLTQSDLSIAYLTSDPHDPLLKRAPGRVKVLYFRFLLPFVILFLDAKVLIMTMTDLHRHHIRRSVRGAHHVYMFHAMVSTHMVYAPGAFDHYDTVFCVGPHHVTELRRAEALGGLPPKHLVEVGYPYLERIHADHQRLQERARQGSGKPRVLVAPSWGVGNILETCLEELVRVLVGAGYHLIVRPHPEFVRRRSAVIEAFAREFAMSDAVDLELEGRSDQSIHDADVLITDWSGMALEYAFGTERPVLFIDVPPKVRNPGYQALGIPPVEVALRSQIGIVIRPEHVNRIDETIQHLLTHREAYRERIRRCRPNYVYHFGHASDVAVRACLALCRDEGSAAENLQVTRTVGRPGDDRPSSRPLEMAQNV